MNIKNYFKKGLLTLTAATALLAGTVSCSSEVTTQEAPVSSTHKVTFTLGNATLTRAAASTGGFDREKAIDPAKFYIVAFQGGSWIKTISPQDLTYTDGEPGTLSFDMVALGTINFYFVANTTNPTKLTGLTTATTETNFFTVVDNTPVGENGATTDGFLMVGKVENVSVSGAATDLGTVTMTRRAARIDIDGSDIADLVIKSVTINKRYNGGSLLVRDGSNTAVTGTPVQTKYITTGTPGANEMLVAATTTGALVSNDQWQGVIYGYENPETDTEVTVDVEFDGFARSATAKFSEAKDASGNADPKAVIANTLYTIKLMKAGEGTDPTQQLAATIEVVDWNESELSFTDLADSEQPSFTSTTDGGTTTLSNPATIRVSKTDATTVDLTVTSGGVFASTLNFIEGQDDNGDALAYNPSSSARALPAATRAVSGTTIAPTETSYEDGHIVQTYSLPISAALGTQLGSRGYLKFRVLNAFDQTSYREFYIRADYTITATLSQTEYTYDGTAKQPTLATLTVVNDEGQEEDILTSESSNYTYSLSNNTNAGTATATVTFNSGTYEGNGTSVEFTINKADEDITLSATTLLVIQNRNANFTVTHVGDGVISATSSDTGKAVCSVDQETGTVTVTYVADGSATITVTVDESTNYNAYTTNDKTVSITTTADPGYELTSTDLSIGMIIAANGKAYNSVADANEFSKAEAMIAYLGNASNCTHGVAIALDIMGSEAKTFSNYEEITSLLSTWSSEHPVEGHSWRLVTMDDFEYIFIACGSSNSYVSPSSYTDTAGFDSEGFRTLYTQKGGTLWAAAHHVTDTDVNGVKWLYSFGSSRDYTFYQYTPYGHPRYYIATLPF